MKKIINLFGLKFYITQYQWARKLYGSKWYKVYAIQLSMGAFWSDQYITSCQSKSILLEEW